MTLYRMSDAVKMTGIARSTLAEWLEKHPHFELTAGGHRRFTLEHINTIRRQYFRHPSCPSNSLKNQRAPSGTSPELSVDDESEKALRRLRSA